MLTGIEITNYRGIRAGKVDGFGTVNILVGPNGSGKSCLLEAIFMGGHGHPGFIFQDHIGRQEPVLSLRHNEHGFPNDGFWFRKATGEPIRIDYRFGSYISKLILSHGQRLGWKEGLREGFASFFAGLKLLDVRLLLDSTVEHNAWDQLLNIRGDRDLVRVMNQVYKLNLESFSYSVTPRALKALFTDRDFALNIDDLGAGMRIAFRLFISILLTRESALLVEEFDGYQHAGTFPRFVEALFALAVRAKSQLFLATHSHETVEAFVREAQKPGANVELKVFQTSLTPDGTFRASCLSGAEAETLISGGFDIRSPH